MTKLGLSAKAAKYLGKLIVRITKHIAINQAEKKVESALGLNDPVNISQQSLDSIQHGVASELDPRLADINNICETNQDILISILKSNNFTKTTLAELLDNNLENLDLLEQIDSKLTEQSINLQTKLEQNQSSIDEISTNQNSILQHHRNLALNIAVLHKDIASIKNRQELQLKSQEFNNKIQNIQHGFSIIANMAYFDGNPKLAQKLAVTGNAITSVTSIIAGLKGVGMSAGMGPLGAAAGLISAFTSIASLLDDDNGQENSMQILFDAILAISQQINNLRKEMHERFDEVMKVLNQIQQDILFGICELTNDITLAMQKLESIQQQLADFKTQNNYEHESLFSTIKQIKQTQSRIQIKNKWEQTLMAIELAENYTIRDKEHLQDFANRMDNVYTLLDGNASCKSSELAGPEITNFHKNNNPEEVIDLLDAYQSPIIPIATITSYQHDLNLPNDYFYTVEHINYLTEQLQNTSNIIAKTHLLSSLLLKTSNNEDKTNTLTISSLSNTLKQIFSEQFAGKTLFIPLLVNGNYSLIIAQANPVRFYYFGDRSKLDRIEKIIKQTTKITAPQQEEPFVIDKDCYKMPTYLPKNYNALWILNIIKTITQTNNLPQLINAYQTNQHDNTAFSAFMPIESYQRHHDNWQKLLKDQEPLFTKPVNPLIWSIVTQRYTALFTNKLFIHHPANAGNSGYTEPCCYSDLEKLQNLVNTSQYTRQLITRTQNVELFNHLINNYSDAIKQLQQELGLHLQNFERQQSQILNQQVTAKLQNNHRKQLCSQLRKQEIVVRGDYPIDNIRLTLNMQGVAILICHSVNIDKWHNGNSSYTQNYIKQQSEQIKQQIARYIEEYKLKQILEHENKLNLFEPNQIVTKSIPCVILPTQPNSPFLPSNSEFINFIPEIYFNAQNLGLGEIIFKYTTDQDNKSCELNTYFYCYKTKESLLISTRKAEYDQLFYDQTEGIWWAMVGGNCSINPNETQETNLWSSPFTPKLHFRPGILNQHDLLIEQILDNSEQHQQNLTKITNLINEKNCELRTAWHKEIQHMLKADTASSLSKAFAKFDVHYKLLKAALEVSIPLEQHTDIEYVLSSILKNSDNTHNTSLFVGNQAAIIKLLEHKLTIKLSSCLPNDIQLNELKFIIHKYLESYLEQQYIILDQAETNILNTIDNYLPTAQPNRADINILSQQDVKVLSSVINKIMGINPNDAEAVKNAQQMLQNICNSIDPSKLLENGPANNSKEQTTLLHSFNNNSASSSNTSTNTYNTEYARYKPSF